MLYCYGKAELDSSYFAKAASYEIFSHTLKASHLMKNVDKGAFSA